MDISTIRSIWHSIYPGGRWPDYAEIRCDLLQPATSLLFDLMDSFQVSQK